MQAGVLRQLSPTCGVGEGARRICRLPDSRVAAGAYLAPCSTHVHTTGAKQLLAIRRNDLMMTKQVCNIG
jgi:hypothetical protein